MPKTLTESEVEATLVKLKAAGLSVLQRST